MYAKEMEKKLECYRAQARDSICKRAKFLAQANKNKNINPFDGISDIQTVKNGEWIMEQAMNENMNQTQIAMANHNKEVLLRLGKERGETRKMIQTRLEEIAKEERLKMKAQGACEI